MLIEHDLAFCLAFADRVTVVYDVLLQLRESGETVMIAGQNLDLALAVAGRVYVLDHSSVVLVEEAARLTENSALVQQPMGV